jgi:uncharacterized membrane protein YeiH
VMTATVGGILRDVVAAEPSVLLQREVYVTAALSGAAVFVFMTLFGAPGWLAGCSGFITAFLLRAGAMLYGWTVPAYRGRAGRKPEDIR